MGLVATGTVDNVVDAEKEAIANQIEICKTGEIDLAEVYKGNPTRYCKFTQFSCEHGEGKVQTASGYRRYCTRS
ncbi:MAG: hypothetical protein Q7J54_02330 [Candidatus Woesearchaeota archaeon]|nr:hypothetical protein [Candidatus Woesearchaeota archaeon]